MNGRLEWIAHLYNESHPVMNDMYLGPSHQCHTTITSSDTASYFGCAWWRSGNLLQRNLQSCRGTNRLLGFSFSLCFCGFCGTNSSICFGLSVADHLLGFCDRFVQPEIWTKLQLPSHIEVEGSLRWQHKQSGFWSSGKAFYKWGREARWLFVVGKGGANKRKEEKAHDKEPEGLWEQAAEAVEEAQGIDKQSRCQREKALIDGFWLAMWNQAF